MTSIFSAAAHPERIRVAVVDQIVAGQDGSCDIPHSPCSQDRNQPICLYKDQIDVYQMEAELAVGPVFARHIGYRLYRGEYYAMQSDAHVTFTKGWDVDIISQIEATGDEMAVLTTYLTDIVGSIDPKTGLSLRKTRPIMCNTEYEGNGEGRHLRHLSQPEGVPDIHGMPQLQVSFLIFHCYYEIEAHGKIISARYPSRTGPLDTVFLAAISLLLCRMICTR